MYKTHLFLIMTTDPVHIGTGGMRLGRVDNTIVREPGTKLPKTPGTALHGAIRVYAARRYGKPQCAGQGSAEGRRHCGRPTCPICYTFGSIQGEANSFSGVVSIGDARILLFPVYSMVGPVWVSTVGILKEAGFTIENKHGKDSNPQKEKAYLTWDRTEPINLGWLMVEVGGKVDISMPKDLKNESQQNAIKAWEAIRNRIVLVPDNLFSQIVNSNLEIRTSVAINPETGAAEEGALFTYEAIPRTTFLWFDVVEDDFRGSFPSRDRLEKFFKDNGKDFQPDEKPNRDELEKKGWKENDQNQKEDLQQYKNNNLSWQRIIDVIRTGLQWAEHLGIGGMGTRGFGRIKEVTHWEVNSKTNSKKEETSGEKKNDKNNPIS